MAPRTFSAMLVLASLLAAPGCTWWRGWVNAPQAPTAFTGPPTIQQIAQHLNSNPVQQLESESARISISGLPSLSARFALERPRNVRFRVETGFTGPELDLGSNQELFWLWAKRNDPPAVLYARHDRFAGSAARRMIPVQPEWIGEALGVLYFDPQGEHEGPYERGNHRLEVRTRLRSPDGDLTRVLVINDVYGWILEQHLYDAHNQLIASAKATEHRHYRDEGVSLPHRVEINLPPANMAFTLDVGKYRINSLSGDQSQLWQMPTFTGYPLVDVADPSFSIPGAAGANRTPGTHAADARAGQRPPIRGYR